MDSVASRTDSPAWPTVDLDRPMEAVRELRRRVSEGFVGLRVVPWLWNAPPTDRRYYPLFAECVESAVPFCTQVGHTGPLRPVGDRTPDSLHRPGGPRLSGVGDRVRARRLSVDRGNGRRRAQARERLHRHLGVHHQAAAGGADPVHENRYRTTQSLVRHQLSDDRSRARAGRARRTRARADEARHDFLHGNAERVFRLEARTDERCPGPDQHPGRRRRRRVLRQPGHLGDALRRRTGHRSADARRAGPFRRRRHRRGRRYARIADRPAAVLLHLGPGLGNGLANLHNARRARVPMVVVVGDHATYHKKYDAPLESDIDALAGTVSGWVRRTADAADVGADAAEAIAAEPGRLVHLDADPARRRVLVRRRAARRGGARAARRRRSHCWRPRRWRCCDRASPR